MIAFGDTEITGVYIGATEVSKMYLGDELVYGSSGEDFEDNLVYWWSGEDALVNGYWVDRVSEKQWTQYGGIMQESDNSYRVGSEKYGTYFTMNGNNEGINLGSEWKIVVTLSYEAYYKSGGSWLIDFGSVANTNHAFGLFFTSNRYFNDNYKGFANNNTSTYGVVGNSNKLVIPTDTVITLTYGCRKLADDSYIQYATYNDVTIDAPNAHAETSFNANFNKSTFYIGRSYASSYNGAGKIYELKIYSYS